MEHTNKINRVNSEELQRIEIERFGFWIYLMSDLVIFSILFTTFIVHNHNFADASSPKELFDIPNLFIETLLLLSSSMTFGVGMVAMQQKKVKWVIVALVITFILGIGFIALEIHEFLGLIKAGYGPDRSSFLSSFFTLVGTHGTHVSFGLLWMFIMIYQLLTKGLTIPIGSRVMRLALFWHFLDIVWVGVFTVVYLVSIV
jgi:cytochrome o ubiquinol oxidase subunit III